MSASSSVFNDLPLACAEDSEESCRDPAVVLLPEVSADEVAAAEARLSLAASADGEALLESFPAQWRSLYSHPQKLRALF